MEGERRRPFGVTVLAILAFIAFLVAVLVTLLLVGVIPAALLGGTGFFGSLLLGAILWGLCAAIWGWVTIGLWELNPKTWLFVVVLATLNIVLALISVLGASTWQAMWPSIVINAVILIYGLLPGVRSTFGELPPQV